MPPGSLLEARLNSWRTCAQPLFLRSLEHIVRRQRVDILVVRLLVDPVQEGVLVLLSAQSKWTGFRWNDGLVLVPGCGDATRRALPWRSWSSWRCGCCPWAPFADCFRSLSLDTRGLARARSLLVHRLSLDARGLPRRWGWRVWHPNTAACGFLRSFCAGSRFTRGRRLRWRLPGRPAGVADSRSMPVGGTAGGADGAVAGGVGGAGGTGGGGVGGVALAEAELPAGLSLSRGKAAPTVPLSSQAMNKSCHATRPATKRMAWASSKRMVCQVVGLRVRSSQCDMQSIPQSPCAMVVRIRHPARQACTWADSLKPRMRLAPGANISPIMKWLMLRGHPQGASAKPLAAKLTATTRASFLNLGCVISPP